MGRAAVMADIAAGAARSTAAKEKCAVEAAHSVLLIEIVPVNGAEGLERLFIERDN